MVTIDELMEQPDHDNVTSTVKEAELAVDGRRPAHAPSVLAMLHRHQAAALNMRPICLNLGAVNDRCATGASPVLPAALVRPKHALAITSRVARQGRYGAGCGSLLLG